jgi:SNW domain-containing protein 1
VNKKIPKGPPSPPAPVLHSPTRKVTVKEQQEWKIPPCISNWKNPKGYTIPLDKRLAADGRGLQAVHINENFSKFAEALYLADRSARDAIEMRAKMEQTIAQKEKAKKEEDLAKLANQVREQRSGIKPLIRDDSEVAEREEIRKDREKERRRDRAIQRAAPEKRTQLQKEKERDVSEKIALGLPNTGYNTGEIQYDSRLFNSSTGLDTGFGDEEAYTVYDKPWRETESVKNAIYRPSKNVDKDYGDEFEKALGTKRFVPDKGFEGAEKNGGRGEGPVAFEQGHDANFDPFKIDDFLGNLKKGNVSADSGGNDKRKGGDDGESHSHKKHKDRSHR